MVETNVIGFSKQKRLVEYMVKTVMDNLNLNVPLTVRKLKLKNEDTLAFAYDVMDSYGLCVFENCPPEKLQEVISHELIHIEQMVRCADHIKLFKKKILILYIEFFILY